jgi:urease accessory protein UreF
MQLEEAIVKLLCDALVMVAMLWLKQQLGQQVFVTRMLMMALHFKKMMMKKLDQSKDCVITHAKHLS